MTNPNIRYEKVHFPITTKQFIIVIGASLTLLLVGISLFAGEDSFEVCQSNYAKATTQIMEYNKENPKYMIELPKYNCINLVNKGTENVTPSSDVPPKSNEPKEVTLRDKFGLGDCRFINESHELKKYKLEWMAYDIACEKGVAFNVKSPGNYIIEKVGFGYNIGNFIIAKRLNDNVRIVLGHTETSLKEGHIIKEGDIIGNTNLSGESTGMHVHIELWEGYKYADRNMLLTGSYNSWDGTRLLNHRGWDFGQPEEAPPTYYFTSYNLGDPNQNDASPCIGASGKDLCYLESAGVRTMALTSDIRQQMGITFGDTVRLTGDKGCEGTYQVEDEMNKRFRQTPGVLRPGTNYYIKGDLPSKEGGACSITKL